MRNTQNGSVIFEIDDKRRQNNNADIFIRTHPPLRSSTLGAPMLLVSVVDHRSAEKLVELKSIQQHQAHEDFKRIMLVSSGKEVVHIATYTEEESTLLRYVLRLNSTKMQPSAWQVKNLPRYESWFPSFLSPLYVDCLQNLTPMKPFSASKAGGLADSQRNCCDHCKSFKEGMKRCSRCKAVFYCDAECQKAAWRNHKSLCSA